MIEAERARERERDDRGVDKARRAHQTAGA
jgi:hypothetical protein